MWGHNISVSVLCLFYALFRQLWSLVGKLAILCQLDVVILASECFLQSRSRETICLISLQLTNRKHPSLTSPPCKEARFLLKHCYYKSWNDDVILSAGCFNVECFPQNIHSQERHCQYMCVCIHHMKVRSKFVARK